MQLTAPGGVTVRIGRRWLPWRPRPRDTTETGNFAPDLIGDDPFGFVAGLALTLLMALLLPLLVLVVLLLSEILLVLLLLPVAVALRIVLRRPWRVEVRADGTLLGAENVQGWRASGERIDALAAAYAVGQGPFPLPAPAG